MKRKNKYRVLLHAMTFKRDFGLVYVLSKLLEHLGCECIIVNTVNLHKKYYKLWNPHVVFYVTLSHTKSIRRSYPKAKLFLLPAEGGYEEESEELLVLDDLELLDQVERIFLWGKATDQAMLKKAKHLGLSKDVIDKIESKCIIAGNPRMDIARFFPEKPNKTTAKLRIGIIGNFFYLNNRKFPTLRVILNSELPAKGPFGKLDEINFQIRQLKTYCDLIRELGVDDYSYSIRPYPLEQIESYSPIPPFGDFPFQLNDYIDFSSWVMEQDVIIGATSTTISQIAIAQKPYINIDVLNERKIRDYDYKMAASLEKHQPENFDELLEMIKNYSDYKFHNPVLTEKLDYYYNANNHASVLYTVAKNICKKMNDNSEKGMMKMLPKSFALKCDYLWSLYIEWRNKEIFESDYSYFRLGDALPKAGSEFKQVIDAIIEKNT